MVMDIMKFLTDIPSPVRKQKQSNMEGLDENQVSVSYAWGCSYSALV